MRSVAIGSSADARFVHQNDLRTNRNRARNTETLLLPAGQTVGALLEFIFHLIPQRRPRSDCSTSSSILPLKPLIRAPQATFS